MTFGYTGDRSNGQYGNMGCVANQSSNGSCPQYTFNAANNQIVGYTYDAAGNMTVGGGHTYQYDAESRLISVDGGSTESYAYNALGQEVRFYTPSWYTFDYLYDPAGHWIGRMNSGAWDVPGVFHVGGRRFALYVGGATYFVHTNALGSTAMDSNFLGQVVGDMLLYPWGQSWAGGSPTWQYAGFEFGDPATGFYPTANRSYPVLLGRWLTPDPSRFSRFFDDPQTLEHVFVCTQQSVAI